MVLSWEPVSCLSVEEVIDTVPAFVHVVMVTLAAQSGCQPGDVPAVQLWNPRFLVTSIAGNDNETLCYYIMHSCSVFISQCVSMGYITMSYNTYMSTHTYIKFYIIIYAFECMHT